MPTRGILNIDGSRVFYSSIIAKLQITFPNSMDYKALNGTPKGVSSCVQTTETLRDVVKFDSPPMATPLVLGDVTNREMGRD